MEHTLKTNADLCHQCYSKRANWMQRLTGYIIHTYCNACRKHRACAVVTRMEELQS